MLITNGKTKTKSNIKTRICASLGLRMKFKTLFTWVTPIKQDLMHYRKKQELEPQIQKISDQKPAINQFCPDFEGKTCPKKKQASPAGHPAFHER